MKKFDSARYLYWLAGLVAIVAASLLTWFLIRRSLHQSAPKPQFIGQVSNVTGQLSVACPFRRALDGVCVKDVEEVNGRLVAVMIENSRDAWPLSGLAPASVVYEAPAEGEVPRFLAIFPENESVDKVGPVRSARPYYLSWLREYSGAMYMHVGGSPDALDEITRSKDIFDLNEFFKGWYFWRSDDRRAPHNTYTSSNLWQKAWTDYGKKTENDVVGWKFDDRVACAENCATEISATFLSPTYIAVWKYNTTTAKYERWQNRVRQVDQNGEEINADTIIIQQTTSRVLDSYGRKQVTTVGSGAATLFVKGHKIDGQWKKTNITARTVWSDTIGNEIPLQPGKIWIEVLTENGKLTWE